MKNSLILQMDPLYPPLLKISPWKAMMAGGINFISWTLSLISHKNIALSQKPVSTKNTLQPFKILPVSEAKGARML